METSGSIISLAWFSGNRYPGGQLFKHGLNNAGQVQNFELGLYP